MKAWRELFLIYRSEGKGKGVSHVVKKKKGGWEL